MQGTLLKAFGGFYFVQAAGEVFSCSLRGRLKLELKELPLGLIVGDSVEITPLNEQLAGMEAAFAGAPADMPKAVIEAILPRSNYLIRPKIANVQQCIIVLAAKHPKPDFLLLDKLIVALLAMQIQPVIVLNKMDQNGAEKLLAELQIYQAANIPVLPVSAAKEQGIEALKSLLNGKISAVAGQSGVGKSTLLNLLQANQQLATGDISHKLQRGRHTTRTVELLPLSAGGWIADTPGFSRLDFPPEIKAEDLAGFYPDFTAFADGCRFDMCRHENEPDCRVKEAVAARELSAERYQRYLVLLNLLANKNDRNY